MERIKALYALTATMLIWGFTPVATRFLARDLPPGDVLVIRYLFCGLAFAALLTAIGGWSLKLRDLPRFIACALTGVASYNICSMYGFQTTPATLGGLMLGTEPAMIAVLAALLLGEALTGPVIIGSLLAFVGTVVLLGGGLMQDVSSAPTGVMGPLLVLAGAVSWSVYVVLIKPLLITYGPVKASALASAMGTPLILLLAREQTLDTVRTMSPGQWAVIAFLAVFGTLVSLFLWNYGNRHVTSARAGAFIYALPVISVSAGGLVLGEPVTLPLIVGGALILAGVAIAQFTPRTARRSDPAGLTPLERS